MLRTLPWLALALIGCTEPLLDTGLDSSLIAELQLALDEGGQQGEAPGATLSVVLPGEGAWVGTTGFADTANEVPTDHEDRFRIGSITKTFVGALVLLLEDEGALSREDLVSAWLPDAPHASEVRIRHLLSHTSGLDDYVDELPFLGHPDNTWEPEELIAFISDRELIFEPGSDYSYSNTNFILVGMIVDLASGQTWGEGVRERFLEPLRLSDITIPSEQPGTDTDVNGYFGEADVTDLYNPTGSWAAGEMVSDAEGLTRWASALYGGEVLPPAQLEVMTSPTPLNDGNAVPYGVACQIRQWQDRPTVGHSGSTMGFVAQLRYDTETGATTAVLVNDFLADTSEIDTRVWDVLIDQYFPPPETPSR
jgi:D-alanyl-D-alanine carboxypeptidase